MRYNNISLEVLIKGRAITEYPHNGRTFVEGRANSAFEVRITNHNAFRVEAVISVDGLSVTDGKDAGPDSTGYVLDAGQSAVIPGWKLSAEQVAAFEFAGKGNSYASHASGSTRNTGVIGVMAFKDRYAADRLYTTQIAGSGYGMGQISPTDQWNFGARDASHLNTLIGVSRSAIDNRSVIGGGGNGIGDMGWASNMAVGAAAMTFAADNTPTINAMCMNAISATTADSGTLGATRGIQASAQSVSSRRVQAKSAAAPEPVQQNLGTAFGQAQDFATTTVSFHRGDMTAMLTAFYDDARGLRSRGIDLSRKAKAAVTQTPNAFPGMGCAPPPGWRG